MNVHDEAHNLARAIKESFEYKEYVRMKDTASRNEELAAMLNDFQAKQFEIQAKQMLGGELDQDLVVLCRHGGGSVRRFVFGSNAERVVMHGESPVLLVHADESFSPRTFGPSSIVLLLEASTRDESALEFASALAGLSQSHLYLLAVVPTMRSISAQEASTGRLFPYTTRHVLDFAAEECTESIQKVVDKLVSAGVKATGRVERGDTASAVVNLAASVQADLVILNSRNLAGLSAFWANDVPRKVAGAYDGVLLLLPSIEVSR
jgi:nucleotide-binding universal stress UspA family protein